MTIPTGRPEKEPVLRFTIGTPFIDAIDFAIFVEGHKRTLKAAPCDIDFGDNPEPVTLQLPELGDLGLVAHQVAEEYRRDYLAAQRASVRDQEEDLGFSFEDMPGPEAPYSSSAEPNSVVVEAVWFNGQGQHTKILFADDQLSSLESDILDELENIHGRLEDLTGDLLWAAGQDLGKLLRADLSPNQDFIMWRLRRGDETGQYVESTSNVDDGTMDLALALLGGAAPQLQTAENGVTVVGCEGVDGKLMIVIDREAVGVPKLRLEGDPDVDAYLMAKDLTRDGGVFVEAMRFAKADRKGRECLLASISDSIRQHLAQPISQERSRPRLTLITNEKLRPGY